MNCTKSTSHFAATSLVVAMTSGLAAPGSTYAADGNRATSDILQTAVIPYEGTLMLDGNPATGVYQVRFELWDHASNGNTGLHLRYAEVHSVEFFSGRFSVGIGSEAKVAGLANTFIDAVLDADKLYLGISVFDTTRNAYVPLSGRQAIEAVPFSSWTGNAANLSVAGTMSVGRLFPSPSSWVEPPAATRGAGIVNDVGGLQALVIVGNDSDPQHGVRRLVEVWDDLDVQQNIWVGRQADVASLNVRGHADAASLTVNGNFTTSGPPPVVCVKRRSGCSELVNTPTNFLDRQGNIRCAHGEWMQGWQMIYGCANGAHRQFEMDCCRINWNRTP